jgi:endonuclease YncB( thermonuclease family)
MKPVQMPLFRGARRAWLIAAAALLAALLASLVPDPAASPVSGRAIAVDGDTLRLDGRRVRVLGIDAPELEQSCTDAAGAAWDCGKAARDFLAGVLRGADVVCEPQGRDRYGRMLARCRAGGADIGESLVKAGLAVAYGDYLVDEGVARAGRKGIWAGRFVAPSTWRREQNGDGGEPGLIGLVRSWFR